MIDFILSFGKFCIIYLTIASIIFQYFFVLKMFFDDEWKTKKEFLLHLIPLYPQGYLLKDFAIDIKKMAKESWKKLK